MTTEHRPLILCVDDRTENLLALKTLLRGLPAEVVTASSGQAALEVALSREAIAVILLDVQMPGMDGFETAEALRLIESTKHIPIVFVTANDSQADQVFKGYECGAVDYLPKPIPEYALKSKVRVFLEMAQQRHALTSALAELNQSKQDLERSNEELGRSNEALQDFAHAAAHDLKAPIRHISAWAKILRDDAGEELSDESKATLTRIEASSTRMGNLVGGMLGFAQLDADPPALRPVSLASVVSDVLEEFSGAIETSGATVDVADLPRVMGHAGLLHQLFQNLIGNALKYHKPDVPPRIRLSSTGDDPRHWRVLVADEGIGFPPERADLIFQPFRRLVGSAFEGSGIGMASAKKIVRLQGGTISAVGRLGEGATFTVVLPRAESPPKLLIVDDDDLELQVASGALAGCGFEILTACSGEEALKIVGETSVHTVLTDYQMLGGEHGIWLLERVRAIRPQTRRLLTSSIEIAGLAEVKRSGLVHDFFAKTVTAEQLLACQPPACQVVESASSSATGQGRMAS